MAGWAVILMQIIAVVDVDIEVASFLLSLLHGRQHRGWPVACFILCFCCWCYPRLRSLPSSALLQHLCCPSSLACFPPALFFSYNLLAATHEELQTHIKKVVSFQKETFTSSWPEPANIQRPRMHATLRHPAWPSTRIFCLENGTPAEAARGERLERLTRPTERAWKGKRKKT